MYLHILCIKSIKKIGYTNDITHTYICHDKDYENVAKNYYINTVCKNSYKKTCHCESFPIDLLYVTGQGQIWGKSDTSKYTCTGMKSQHEGAPMVEFQFVLFKWNYERSFDFLPSSKHNMYTEIFFGEHLIDRCGR